MANVTLENVTKRYGDLVTVNEVNLEIKDQEFMVLVGPSGSGKSTILRMVAGLEGISSGSIFIGDRRVNDVPPKDRDIAMVFQSYALYPHMTVFDNMAYGLKLRHMPKDQINKMLHEVAQTLEIDHLLERKPKALSGGQRQRVALGRAIVREPRVFLMDEPLSNLDAKLRVQTRTTIAKLHQRLQTTVIYVTHDQTEAMTMADRIVVLKDGMLQQTPDTAQHLYDTPANMFVAGFIGSPPMNFFKVILRGLHTEPVLDAGSFQLRLPGRYREQLAPYIEKGLIFGVRPEHLMDTRFAPPGEVEGIGNTAQVNVEVVEPLGSEVYVYLSSGSHNFTARLDTRTETRPGEKLEITFDENHYQFFDQETQGNLLLQNTALAH